MRSDKGSFRNQPFRALLVDCEHSKRVRFSVSSRRFVFCVWKDSNKSRKRISVLSRSTDPLIERHLLLVEPSLMSHSHQTVTIEQT